MKQVARNLTDGMDGFLSGTRYLLHACVPSRGVTGGTEAGAHRERANVESSARRYSEAAAIAAADQVHTRALGAVFVG